MNCYPNDYVQPLIAEVAGQTIVESFVAVEGSLHGWVSNFGRCFSSYFKRLLEVGPSVTGYVATPFRWKHKLAPHFATRQLHRVVAYYFCNPPSNYQSLVPDHINSVRHDNFFKNLEWVTCEENMRRAFLLGQQDKTGKTYSLWFRANGHRFSSIQEAIEEDMRRLDDARCRAGKRGRVLPVDLIKQIRREAEEGATPVELFKRHGIFPDTICRLIQGVTYRWVHEGASEADRPKPGPRNVSARASAGESFKRTFITAEFIEKILVLKEQGQSNADISEALEVHPGTVKLIAGGRHPLQKQGQARSPLLPADPYASRRGPHHAKAKVTEQIVEGIYRDRFWLNINPHQIGKKYGIGAPTIYAILTGTHWMHKAGLVQQPDVWQSQNPRSESQAVGPESLPEPSDTEVLVEKADPNADVDAPAPRTQATRAGASTDWRPLSADYSVSKQGEIWSVINDKVLKTKIGPHGYEAINLARLGGTKLVHHLVAQAWLGPAPSPTHVVDHIDNVPTNNRASNLEWVSRKENTRRAFASGRVVRTPYRALTLEQVYEVRRAYGSTSLEELARRFRAAPVTVRSAIHGKPPYDALLDTPPVPLPRAPGTWRPGAGGKRHEGPRLPDGHPVDYVEALPGERWRPIAASGYWISDQGRVFSAKSRRLKKRQVTRQKYLRVQLRIDNNYKNCLVHKLVALIFLPPPPAPGMVVGHLNDNPQDARAVNLAWITRRRNAGAQD